MTRNALVVQFCEGKVNRALVILSMISLAACGSSDGGSSNPITPSPQPPTANRNPSITAMNVSPAFGMAGMTSFSFNASASDPDSDALSFSWNVAGNPASGTAGTIIFAASNTGGQVAANLTVSDGRGGSATDSRTVVLGSMTGDWVITAGPLVGSTFTLTQTSAGVTTGSFSLPGIGNGNTDPAQPGRITEAGALTMRVKIGAFADFTM